MPIVGLIGAKGELIKLDDYLDNLDKFDFPSPLLHLIVKDIVTNPHKGEYISVTALLGCVRQTYLSRIYDIYVYPKRMWWVMRGQLIHKILEDQPKGIIVEKEFSIVVDGIEVFGRIDYYNPKTKHLQDFKTIGDRGAPFILKGGAKSEHVSQGNMYKVLLEENGYPVDKLSIIYMSMMIVFETGTTYIQESKSADVEYKIEDVKIYDKEKTIEAMTIKAKILDEAFKTGKLPPPPDEDTQKWLCGETYCSVANHCPHYEQMKKGK